MKTVEKRLLSKIAHCIKRDWIKPAVAAVPYLNAMSEIDSVDKRFVYIAEPAEQLVNGFLSNCSTWRGPGARALKAELKAWVS